MHNRFLIAIEIYNLYKNSHTLEAVYCLIFDRVEINLSFQKSTYYRGNLLDFHFIIRYESGLTI